MAHRVKCPVCNSCMSPFWLLPTRYYYCGFCHVYYTGRDDALEVTDNPYKDRIVNPNKIEDPVEEK